MFSYGYNPQGPSISRLDELLNRNELIYQNLKQKLDDINKSDLNIKRNITHIHSNYPPHTGSYTQSSMIQQEHSHRSPYSHNLSSINESNQLTFSQALPHDDFAQNILREQRIIELMKESNRLREAQLVSQRKKLQEQLRFNDLQRQKKRKDAQFIESQRSKQSQKSTRRQISPHNQPGSKTQNSYTYFPPSALSKDYKIHKGNEIYLTKIPKTSDQSQSNIKFDNIPNFRQNKGHQRQLHLQTLKNKDDRQITFMQQQKHQNIHQFRPQSYPRISSQFHASKQQHITQQLKDNEEKVASYRENTFKEQTPQQNDFNFTAVSLKEANNYRQLNKNIQKHLFNIINASQCYLFMPFNKVYRSPIIQIKPGGNVLLQRKSKTAPIGKDQNIADPIKYKFKSVVTDEQIIIKLLFGGNQRFEFTPLKDTKRIAILGKRDTLKKKLHMGLLAYLLQTIKKMIGNARNGSLLRIQHQEVGSEGKGKTVEAEVQVRIGSERVALLQLQRVFEDICQTIKGGGIEQKVLRVSKISSKGDSEWSFSIIGSNRVDKQFVRCLSASRICWSVNPLIKNYQDVRVTLQSMRHFVASNSV